MRKNLDPRNTHKEKNWTHEILTRKENLETRNTYEKKFEPTKYEKKIWNLKILTGRNLDP